MSNYQEAIPLCEVRRITEAIGEHKKLKFRLKKKSYILRLDEQSTTYSFSKQIKGKKPKLLYDAKSRIIIAVGVYKELGKAWSDKIVQIWCFNYLYIC
jgi:hypothetical protein